MTCDVWLCVILYKDGVWHTLKTGITSGRKMSEMYLPVFKLLSIRTRNVHFMYPMAAKTITPGAWTLSRMQVGAERSH